MNHFQNMPALPGCNSAPSITMGGSGGGKRSGKGKGKGRKNSKGAGAGGDPGESPKRRRKAERDPELHQLDLKRQRLAICRNAAPCLKTKHSRTGVAGGAGRGVERCHLGPPCLDRRSWSSIRSPGLAPNALGAAGVFHNGGRVYESVLSPDSKALKSKIFQKTGELSEQVLTGYKKKMSTYLQALDNAATRLIAVQREEVSNLIGNQRVNVQV